MNILTVNAHHNPHSSCHAPPAKFDAGLRDAAHPRARHGAD
jgi:hypothetical protein